MIVTLEKGGRAISLQVKTGGLASFSERKRNSENSQWTWQTGRKAMEEDRISESYWYAFVYVGEWPKCGEVPQVFFVPSKCVAQRLSENTPSQQDWFWILEKEADHYRGQTGFEQLMEALSR